MPLNQHAARELELLFGQKSVFDTPKPVGLLKLLVRIGSGPNDLVLDFFAGSGALGDAVMQLNAEENEARRYMLVQLPEPLGGGSRNNSVAADYCDSISRPRLISELTKERLRRTSKKQRGDAPMFSGDLGFRVFKLDRSNICAWDPNPEDLEKALFDGVEHLHEGRTEQDVLYELLLKLGIDLCVPIEERTIADKPVHSVGAGTLLVCLSKKIAADEVEALALGMAEWREEQNPAGDTTVVFRDAAFDDDVAKTNIAAILEQHGLETVRSL